MISIHTSRAAQKLVGAHARLARLRERDEAMAAQTAREREAAAAAEAAKHEHGDVG